MLVIIEIILEGEFIKEGREKEKCFLGSFNVYLESFVI